MGMQRMSISDVKDQAKDTEKSIGDSSESCSESSSSVSSKDEETCQSCSVVGPALTLSILCICNLLNYMDRYVIAGVLPDIISFYDIGNAEAGLLSTSFICSYMVLSPVFGYLGDRYNRKLIMSFGIFFWSAITLAGSFIPKDMFWAFLTLRGLVGIGEASYCTIAPTIIADLFVKDARSKALAVFYFAIPVGSGLGYIVGAKVAQALGSWTWALRVTPALGILCLILIIFVVREPVRGQAEGASELKNTGWLQDIVYLFKNKSFVLSSLGFTAVAFVAGAYALWVPAYMINADIIQRTNIGPANISLIFGVITCLAGFLGVGLGSESARRLRKKNPRADPLVCAFGLISCVPFFYGALYLSSINPIPTWIFVFIGEVLLCLNWAIVTDIVLYVVIPTRRSTAAAVQIFASHALGDASSPYIVGAISDAIVKSRGAGRTPGENYISMQYALNLPLFISVIGGGFFLATALFIQKDKAKQERTMRGNGAGDLIPNAENGDIPPRDPIQVTDALLTPPDVAIV